MGGSTWDGDYTTELFVPYDQEYGEYYNGIDDYVTLPEVATTI